MHTNITKCKDTVSDILDSKKLTAQQRCDLEYVFFILQTLVDMNDSKIYDFSDDTR
jgi:hypothetical protein